MATDTKSTSPQSGIEAAKLDNHDAFWKVIESCLTDIHEKSVSEARSLSDQLRKDLERLPDKLNSDLIYHNEPFYVACNLAGLISISEQVKLFKKKKVLQIYNDLLEAYGW